MLYEKEQGGLKYNKIKIVEIKIHLLKQTYWYFQHAGK